MVGFMRVFILSRKPQFNVGIKISPTTAGIYHISYQQMCFLLFSKWVFFQKISEIFWESLIPRLLSINVTFQQFLSDRKQVWMLKTRLRKKKKKKGTPTWAISTLVSHTHWKKCQILKFFLQKKRVQQKPRHCGENIKTFKIEIC